MMNIVLISPIFYITIKTYCLKDYGLPGLPKCNDKEYFITVWYLENLTQSFPVDRTNHTASQSLLCCSQKNALCRNPVVATRGFSNFGISEYNDICRRSFSFKRSGPVRKIAGPFSMREYQFILIRIRR